MARGIRTQSVTHLAFEIRKKKDDGRGELTGKAACERM